jgi:hypothetical protein
MMYNAAEHCEHPNPPMIRLDTSTSAGGCDCNTRAALVACEPAPTAPCNTRTALVACKPAPTAP